MATINTTKYRVLIIVASVRARRIGPSIATWVAQMAQRFVNLEVEVVDLADWPLPMEDEPSVPQLGIYDSEHTRGWSAKINTASAYVFVTPQYNWGYPASLKNALDHLYREWRHKAAAIISYGGHGGNKCAVQLRQVLEALKMRVAPTMPALELSDTVIRTATVVPEQDLVTHTAEIAQALEELVALLAASASTGTPH